MKLSICLVALTFILLLTACIGNINNQGQFNDGLVLSLSADPPRVFVNGNLRLIVDLENKDIKEYKNVEVSIFETGLLHDACNSYKFDTLQPAQQATGSGQFKSFYCYLVAPESLPSSEVTTKIYGKVTYETSFSAVQLIEMISQEYYDTHLGNIEKKPGSYVYRDKNIEVAVDFSNELPIIVRPGMKTFMHVQITNIGNGFVGEITDLEFRPVNETMPNIFQNCVFHKLEQTDNKFPRQSCELALPAGVNYIQNYDAVLEFTYDYEVRAETDVTIMRGY